MKKFNMKYLIFLILFCLFLTKVFCQDTLKLLSPNIRWSITITQSAVRDWKKGETSSFEFNNLFEITQIVKFNKLDFAFNTKMDVGYSYINDKKLMKDFLIPKNNLLYGEGKVRYGLGWKIDPFFMASFRTQIITAYRLNNEEYVKTAEIWDPVESLQTWGFEYYLVKNDISFSSNVGFTLKQIRSYLYNTMTDDYKTPNIKERYKAENGIRWKTSFFIKLDSANNTNYKSMLDLFGTFDDLKVWSVIWENDVKLTIWKALGILLRVNIIYDVKQMKKVQYNQSVSFGFIIDL